jgi:hypothetical protein
MTRPQLLLALVLASTVTVPVGCNCEPDTDVDPDCLDGLQVSATLTVVGELDEIRPRAGDKDIQVRGNRETSDPCIEPNAQSAFTVRLQGDRTASETIPNLAPGAWAINITAFSGGDHAAINHTLALPTGGNASLTFGSNGAGDLVLQ